MTIVKIIIIIAALFIAFAARKQLIDVLDELKEWDDSVLRKAVETIPKESESVTVANGIPFAAKTVREKLVECLEKMLHKLKEH